MSHISYFTIFLCLVIFCGFFSNEFAAAQTAAGDNVNVSTSREQDELSQEYRDQVVKPGFEKAKSSYRQKDYKIALQQFNEVLRMDPNHPWAKLYVERINEKLNRDTIKQNSFCN